MLSSFRISGWSEPIGLDRASKERRLLFLVLHGTSRSLIRTGSITHQNLITGLTKPGFVTLAGEIRPCPIAPLVELVVEHGTILGKPEAAEAATFELTGFVGQCKSQLGRFAAISSDAGNVPFRTKKRFTRELTSAAHNHERVQVCGHITGRLYDDYAGAICSRVQLRADSVLPVSAVHDIPPTLAMPADPVAAELPQS